MNSANGQITFFGSFIAFSSGIFIPLGISLIDPSFIMKENKVVSKDYYIKVLLNGLGGGFITIGLYLLFPSNIRSLWFR